MKQHTIENESLFAQAVRILRAHIGQIAVGDELVYLEHDKLFWHSRVKFSIDISLAELDSKYEGAISECLDALSNNDGVITDADLVHALNPCLANINFISKEKYAKFLRDIEQNGVGVSEDLYDWQMGFPFFFYPDTQTLRLTIIGNPKKM